MVCVDVAVAVAVAEADMLLDTVGVDDDAGDLLTDAEPEGEGLVAEDAVADPVPDVDGEGLELGEGETETVALVETVGRELWLAVSVDAGPSWQ